MLWLASPHASNFHLIKISCVRRQLIKYIAFPDDICNYSCLKDLNPERKFALLSSIRSLIISIKIRYINLLGDNVYGIPLNSIRIKTFVFELWHLATQL